MEEIISRLEKIQELDLQISNLQKQQQNLPEILGGVQKQIQLQSESKEAQQKKIDDLRKNQLQQTGAREITEDRLQRSQEKMEQVKNQQEYQAIQREMDSLNKSLEIFRQHEKKWQDLLDVEHKGLQEIEQKLGQLESQKQVESEKMQSENTTLNQTLNELLGKRAEEAKNIDAKALKLYEKLRSSNRLGFGLVFAAQGRCMGCNLKIPAQLYNELRRPSQPFELRLCPCSKSIMACKE